MPALDALQDRLRAAHTLACGISVDTTHCHAAWAHQLGGVSLSLISDFHPKGELARELDLYLENSGITDRATVIIDAAGVVRYAQSVGVNGKRDMEELVAACEAIDAGWEGAPLRTAEAPRGLPEGAKLYIRDNCMFSRWTLYTRANLGLDLDDALPVVNVSRDPAAKAELERKGGKTQAPALVVGDEVMYESADIAKYLASHCSWR